jgi:azurin
MMNYNQQFFTVSIFLVSFFASSIFTGGTDHKSYKTDLSNIESIKRNTLTAFSGDTVEVKSEGADLSYDVTRINAKAGSELTIKYINSSDMPHNVVLVKSESDINPVGIAALQASSTDYVPESMKDRMFAWTTLARPGETVFVTFTVPEPGTYPYICTYAGHFTMMQGRLISTE